MNACKSSLLIVVGVGALFAASAFAHSEKAMPAPTAKTSAAQATTYSCPMHPDVVSNAPGKCPKCGMDLETKPTAMTFAVTRNQNSVADLQPYLGAMGHLVIVKDDVKTYLHAHPEEHAGAGAGVVSFMTTFPSPGTYKAWAQFQRGGKPIIADFVLRVRAGTDTSPPMDMSHGEHAH